jgi:hypothetical protein
MAGAKFGVEAEYGLVRPDGRFADFANTSFNEVRGLIAPLPDYRHPELRVGDAGIRVKNWYVEGDERFDREGRSTGMAVKGIEVRTPVSRTIGESMATLKRLRGMLEAALEARGWRLAAVGFNPCTAAYDPGYSAWEREFHASHAEHALPEVSTLSYGPDLNFSRAGDTPEGAVAAVERLTYYSPWMVPFSFSAPFHGGALWEGLSYRTWRRTGPRPAALAHLAGGGGHRLVKAASPESQHLRIEFKAFDMVADDALMEELFRLVLGVALADAGELPGRTDVPDAQMHKRAALSGFDDRQVREGAARVVEVAREALARAREADGLPLLEGMLEVRRTPAHGMRERFLAGGPLFEPLQRG